MMRVATPSPLPCLGVVTGFDPNFHPFLHSFLMVKKRDIRISLGHACIQGCVGELLIGLLCPVGQVVQHMSVRGCSLCHGHG